MRPLAERPLAAGEKIPDNPVHKKLPNRFLLKRAGISVHREYYA
jgi:hypothetical protein